MIGGSDFLRANGDGVDLQIKVVPRASEDRIDGVVGGRLKIRIAAPPVKSSANRKLIEFLAKKLGVSRNAVQIKRGQISTMKKVTIRGVEMEHVRSQLIPLGQ